MHVTYRKPRRSPAQVARLLQDFHASGLTQSAFAKQHGLNPSALSLLLKKARLQPAPLAPATTAFVEVELPKPSAPFDFKVTFGGALTLELRSGFVPSEVLSLIEVLKRAPSSDCHSAVL